MNVRKPTPDEKEKSRLTKEEWREYTKTVWQLANVSHSEHPAVFPAEIPERLIKLFTFVGDTVLDPFAGTGTTGVAALGLGRNTIAIDQNRRYSQLAKKAMTDVSSEASFDVRQGDSRDLTWIPDGSVQLVVTSPPYWNKADYGDGKTNLGNVTGYVEFLESLRPVFNECFRVLEPGRKLCIVTANVNQHTDEGLLTFPLATDTTILLRDIGFVMVNELIWNKNGTGGKWGSYGQQRPIFGSYPFPPNFLFKNVHEYILVFAKPKHVKVKGPRVQSLEALMQPGKPTLTTKPASLRTVKEKSGSLSKRRPATPAGSKPSRAIAPA